jgi:NAD(P)-dependent dehydrogenase (short-subunit alcohol dehydrogenase family)
MKTAVITGAGSGLDQAVIDAAVLSAAEQRWVEVKY